jgi:hypothetical protein
MSFSFSRPAIWSRTHASSTSSLVLAAANPPLFPPRGPPRDPPLPLIPPLPRASPRPLPRKPPPLAPLPRIGAMGLFSFCCNRLFSFLQSVLNVSWCAAETKLLSCNANAHESLHQKINLAHGLVSEAHLPRFREQYHRLPHQLQHHDSPPSPHQSRNRSPNRLHIMSERDSFLHLARPLGPAPVGAQPSTAPLNVAIQPQVRASGILRGA